MKTMLRWLLTLLGPAILVYFLLTSDLAKIWEILLTTNGWLFAAASFLVLPFLYAKGWRWRVILEGWNIRISTMYAAILYTLGIYVGSVTPGQGGDVVKAWYLRREGYPLGPGLLSIVVDRFFDVAIMGLLAASGLYFFRTFLPGDVQVLIWLALAGIVAGTVVLVSPRLRRWLSLTLLPKFVPQRLRILASKSGLKDHVLHLSPLRLVILLFASFVTLGFTFARLYLLFLATGVHIAIGPYIAMIAIISLVSVLSVAGIGTRDAVMVVIMTQLAQTGQMRSTAGALYTPKEATALALGISTLFLILSLVNVVLGFVVSLRYPLGEALLAQQSEINEIDEVVVSS